MKLSPQILAEIDPQLRIAGFHAAAPGWNMNPRRPEMTDFDFWYTVRGRGRILIDGRWWDFKKGDLLLMKPGQLFQQEQADHQDPFHSYFVHFLPFGSQRRPQAEQALFADWPTHLPLAYQPRLADIFAKLFNNYIVHAPFSALRLKALMLDVLEIILGHFQRGSMPPQPPAYAKLQQACRFIGDNYARHLSLEMIAENVDLSISYLLTLFRRHMGCSPVQYQIRLRLEAARPLLARGMSVSATAAAVGFKSLHYFSRTFKAHTSMTPTAFADQCRLAAENAAKPAVRFEN